MIESSPILDRDRMLRAVDVASRVRHRTSPNPWVGVTLVQTDGSVTWGATQPVGGRHAEIEALSSAEVTQGATVYTTLEPCNASKASASMTSDHM